MQCPQCKRTVATVAGASRIQCFGCGKIIEVGGKSSVGKTQREDNGGSGAGKALVAGLSIGFGLLVLAGAAVGAYYFFATGNPENTVAVERVEQAGDVEDSLAPVELVPAFVASAEERAKASQVPESIRKQILEMWAAMIATTRPKLLIPKGSVTRNSVEGLLSAIEQREIRNMSALLQVDESDVQAVIQVDMADRAERELAEQQGQS